MMELWKDIPSLPGYQASSEGRVRSIDRVVIDTRGRSYPVRGRVLRLNTSPNGYLRFNTTTGAHAVHCVVLEAFAGPRPPGLQGAHGDGDKANNRIGNLRWATKQENAADKAIHGTAYRPVGERHPGAKLTEDTVKEILRRGAAGEVQRRIADDTGVPFKTVNSIIRRKSWRHVSAQQSDMRAMGRVG